MTERIYMQATFRVTPSQAVALKAMFDQWNVLAGIGSSRFVAFYVDGDGNFKPNVQTVIMGDIPFPHLRKEMEKAALINAKEYESGQDSILKFDYDPVAWMIRREWDQIKTSIASSTEERGSESCASEAPAQDRPS